MDKDTIAIASALAGAAVATTAALVLRRFEKAHDHQVHAAEVIEADRAGRARGWLEGRNARLNEQTGNRDVFSYAKPA